MLDDKLISFSLNYFILKISRRWKMLDTILDLFGFETDKENLNLCLERSIMNVVATDLYKRGVKICYIKGS